ncbi:MAG: GNAT family N-acetyltransferase [Calditrichaeota bacterium]|nr:MAG: GNAT family N-acetyltransferase [Calditrichota bacterium]
MSDIRKLTKKDLQSFSEIASGAFPGMGVATKEDIEKLAEGLKKRHDSKISTFYGLFKGKNLAGGMMLHNYRMNLFGHKVGCGGGGFLVVSLLHKKEHVGRDLCRFFMKESRKNGDLFTALYPFRPDFYRDMGAGYGAKASVYNFAPKDLPKNGSKKYLRELTEKDIPKIIDCFNTYADSRTGMFYDYEEYRIANMKRHAKSKYYGYKKDGKLLGYFALEFLKDNPHDFMKYETRINELIYLNRDVFESFLSFLHSQKDQIDRIQYITFDDTFHFLPKDPRNGSGKMYPSVYHETNVASIGIMYRIVNTKGLFKTLADRSFNDVSIRVKFDIKDTFLPENGKPFVVHFDNGYPTLKAATAKSDVTLKIDIADFSSLILGAVDFNSLYDYKLAELSNSKYVETLFRLFRTDRKPECWTHF